MKTKRLLKITLCAIYALLAADYIVSAIWGGVSYTAGGVPVPDTPLTIPFAVVLILTVIQMFLQKNRYIILYFGVIKILSVAFLSYMLCGYVFYSSYINSGGIDFGNFYSHIYCTVMVALFIVLCTLDFIGEIFLFIAKKND